MDSNSRELVILMDPMWGRLSPVFQSTADADTLLGNVFEPLVDLNPRGGVVAGVSDLWNISEDDRIFRFHIRPGVRFSNGILLTAELYRQSLLASVSATDKDSHNPNALDVLYRLEGFTKANAKKGDVSGLIADGEWLEFRFKKSFRTAFYELTGTRYAPWVRDEKTGEWFGTGPYKIISHKENEEVIFEPNPLSWRKATHPRVRIFGTNDGDREICEKKVHVHLGERRPKNEAHCKGKPVEFLGGGVSGHYLVALNGVPGKIFSNPQFRLAMQYAILKISKENYDEILDWRSFTYDPQFYPPLWPGRLDEAEANSIIESGKKYLKKFASATKKSPIRLAITSAAAKIFIKHLAPLGIAFAKKPMTEDYNKGWHDAAYGKMDYDLNVLSANVVGSDPDGVYHLLGKNGSLHSPAIHRKKVVQTLEAGRNLKSSDNLHESYMKVGKAILEEVPLIHLAFLRMGSYYRSDLIKLSVAALNSDRFQFDLFQTK